MAKITNVVSQQACIQGATFRSLSETPATLPEKAKWENIAVEYHRLQPPGECEWHLPQHKIRIALQQAALLQSLRSIARTYVLVYHTSIRSTIVTLSGPIRPGRLTKSHSTLFCFREGYLEVYEKIVQLKTAPNRSYSPVSALYRDFCPVHTQLLPDRWVLPLKGYIMCA